MEIMDNTYNLKSLNNIKQKLERQYGVLVNTSFPYYKELMIYDKLREIFVNNPEAINKNNSDHIKVIIEKLKYEKNINCVGNKPFIINTIKMAFMQLTEAIYSNPNVKTGKYSHFDIEKVKADSYILPLILLDLYSSEIVAEPDNIYYTACPFDHKEGLSFKIDEGESKYQCYNKNCLVGGNVVKYLENTTSLNFLTIIETLCKAYDINLYKDGKTLENIKLVNAIRKMLRDAKYSALIKESFMKTIEKHPEMTKEDIILTYHFKHISH